VIDGLNNTTAEGWSFAASYIRVQGFEVKGFSDDAFSNYSGGQYLDIIGNHIHDMGRYCATTGIGRDGIFLGSDNVTVEQNVIHDIGRYAPGESGCTNSLYYRTDDHAIYVAGANYVIIRNNIFYRNQHGWSVAHLSQPRQQSFGIEQHLRGSQHVGTRISSLRPQSPTRHSNLAINNNLPYQGTIADATPSGVTRSSNKDNTNRCWRILQPTIFVLSAAARRSARA
jgi:hypothetical protein